MTSLNFLRKEQDFLFQGIRYDIYLIKGDAYKTFQTLEQHLIITNNTIREFFT